MRGLVLAFEILLEPIVGLGRRSLAKRYLIVSHRHLHELLMVHEHVFFFLRNVLFLHCLRSVKLLLTIVEVVVQRTVTRALDVVRLGLEHVDVIVLVRRLDFAVLQYEDQALPTVRLLALLSRLLLDHLGRSRQQEVSDMAFLIGGCEVRRGKRLIIKEGDLGKAACFSPMRGGPDAIGDLLDDCRLVHQEVLMIAPLVTD